MHFIKPVFKISSDLVHSALSHEFFCAVQNARSPTKIKFFDIVGERVGERWFMLANAKTPTVWPPDRQRARQRERQRRSPTQTPTVWPPDRRYRSPTTNFIMHADSIADSVALALMCILIIIKFTGVLITNVAFCLQIRKFDRPSAGLLWSQSSFIGCFSPKPLSEDD